MKVLVACEESQVVCKAFRAKGHEAYSCDIIPCSGDHPEWHILGDFRDHLKGWNLIIGHPPCTYLANSGVCHLYNKEGKFDEDRLGKLQEAHNLFWDLLNADCEKICIENPIPHKYGRLPKYTQIIHPWQFGHMEQKPTCLWLKGLPKLTETNNVKVEMLKLPANKRQRIHYMPPSESRQKERSVTYQGIATGMADQWG
jgi:hypothetical protein